MAQRYDLSKVVNLNRFRLSQTARQKLAQNGFAILESPTYEQPFFVYESNPYHKIPHFITLDAVMHLYHLFFQFALRWLEEKYLVKLVEELTLRLLAESKRIYNEVSDAELKQAAIRNVAYVGVAANLLELRVDIPATAQPMIAQELRLIREHRTLEKGAILPYAIDYSQFVPRGHYTRKPLLKRYFLAVMWYGLFPFTPRMLVPGGGLEPAPLPLRQALLLTYALYRAGLVGLWQKIMTPIDFLVGLADDLTPSEVKAIMDQVYGASPSLSSFADSARLEQFTQLFVSARMPQIRPKVVSVGGWLHPMPDPGTPQLRLLGQRYIPDSEILQELSDPLLRPMPSGLDVMAVLGSARAAQILDRTPCEWESYPSVRRELTERFARLGKREWTRNLYFAWLWVLQAVIRPLPPDVPPLFRTVAWQDKCLQTALASWAQLRHDTILYAKQSLVAAEGGDVPEREMTPAHYVEPNIEAWQRLLELVKLTRQIPLLDTLIQNNLDDLEQMVNFLLTCAQKRLKNEPLTRYEQERLEYIGGWMDRSAIWIASGGQATSWAEVVHPADRKMACIADVHSAIIRGPEGNREQVLEVGVGFAHEIYVIVPVRNRLYLTRGAVFSYYEFPHPLSQRLTDEQWQQMLEKRKAPPPPAWLRPLRVSGISVRERPL
jgi:hypothetical protein